MLVNYLIQSPNKAVNNLSKQMDLQSELKRQHHMAFKYRLKRFAVTKVGISSAFLAGAVVQASSTKPGLIKKYAWLARLLA